MNVDILEKLIPNVLTMITQLAATGVIFIMYKKYLHTPVIEYLDARKIKREDDLAQASTLKLEARELAGKTKLEYENAYKEISAMREKMVREAELEKAKIIESAKDEIEILRLRNDQILENEKKRLYEEVNLHLLEVASSINAKVLSDYSFSEEEMLSALEKEMVSNDYQH